MGHYAIKINLATKKYVAGALFLSFLLFLQKNENKVFLLNTAD